MKIEGNEKKMSKKKKMMDERKNRKKQIKEFLAYPNFALVFLEKEIEI